MALTTASLWAGLLWIKRPSWRYALILGVLLALAVSTRVMALPWAAACLVLLPGASLLLARFRPAQILQMAAVAAIVVALQAPIIARNVTTYDSWQLTSQGGSHLLNWIAPLVLEARDGTPHEAGAREMYGRYLARHGDDEPNPFVRSRDMTSIARDAIGDMGTGAVVKAWVMGAAINVMSPAPILSPPVKSLPRTGFFDTPGDSKLAKVGAFLFRNDSPTYAWILLVSVIGVALVRLGQLGGIVVGFGSRTRPDSGDTTPALRRAMLAFLLLWTAYILIINGPIASPKYRLPVEPVGVITLAFALAAVQGWWTRRRAQSP